MDYSVTKFKVATSNGLGGDTFTRNVMDGWMDGRTYGRQTDFGTHQGPFYLVLISCFCWARGQYPIEMLLLNTHNMFCLRKRNIISNYAL